MAFNRGLSPIFAVALYDIVNEKRDAECLAWMENIVSDPIFLMNKSNYILKLFASFIGIYFLIGCSTEQPQSVASHIMHGYHAFSFNATKESPDIEIVKFQYGNPREKALGPNFEMEQGACPQSMGYNGYPPPILDILYVKWRIKSSGEVYEDTVDLRNKLPNDLTNYRIHFIVRGKKLFVYLITPERRSDGSSPSDGPEEYAWRKTITIYPSSQNN